VNKAGVVVSRLGWRKQRKKNKSTRSRNILAEVRAVAASARASLLLRWSILRLHGKRDLPLLNINRKNADRHFLPDTDDVGRIHNEVVRKLGLVHKSVLLLNPEVDERTKV
jgi:hypothetical protein